MSGGFPSRKTKLVIPPEVIDAVKRLKSEQDWFIWPDPPDRNRRACMVRTLSRQLGVRLRTYTTMEKKIVVHLAAAS